MVTLTKKVSQKWKFNWYEQIKQLEDKDIIPTIAANKSDLYQEKQVANETEEKFANQIGAILLQLRPKMTVGFKPCLITSVKKYFAAAEKKKKDI